LRQKKDLKRQVKIGWVFGTISGNWFMRAARVGNL